MPFLRVDCYVCGATRNYYGEKYQVAPILSTAAQHQGCACSSCGCISAIASGVAQNTNQEFGNEKQKCS